MTDPRLLPGLNRRSFLGAAGLVAAGAGIAACGGAGSANSGSDITLWTAFTESQQATYFNDTITNPWNKAYPKTPLQVTLKPVNTLAQLQQTAVEAGAGPDILGEDGSSTVVPLAEANQILALDGYAEKYGWREHPAALGLQRLDVQGQALVDPERLRDHAGLLQPGHVR